MNDTHHVRTAIVVGELDSANLGDQAIFLGLRALLMSCGYHVSGFGLESGCWYDRTPPVVRLASADHSIRAEIRRRVLSRLPRTVARGLRLAYLPFWYFQYYRKLRRHSSLFSTADLVVLGGGGIIMNNNWHFPLALNLVSRLVSRHGIRYGYSGISVSDRLDPVSRALLRRSFRRATFVHVRDNRSRTLVSRYFAVDTAMVGPDYAMRYRPRRARQRRGQPPHIGINLVSDTYARAPDTYATYLHVLRQLVLDALPSHRITVLTTGWEDDVVAADRFLTSLPQGHPRLASSSPLCSDVDSLQEVIADLDVLVSTRLHAAILAISAGVPSISIIFDSKTSSYLDTIGCGDSWLNAVDLTLDSLKTRIDSSLRRAACRPQATDIPQSIMDDLLPGRSGRR